MKRNQLVFSAARKLELTGDLAGAVEMMREALEETPEDVELQIGLGTFLVQFDPVECIAVLEKAGAKVSADKRSRIYGGLAISYDKVGKTELAIASCRLALADEPELVGPAMLLGRILDEIGERDEALSLFYSLLGRVNPLTRETLKKAIARLETARS